MEICKKHNVRYEPDVLKAMQRKEIESNCCGTCALEKTKKISKEKKEIKGTFHHAQNDIINL